MEFTQEQITEIGLSDEQIPKLLEITNTIEADLKKQWDGKANKDAEGILDGVLQPIEQMTGLKRKQGEKTADFLSFAAKKYFDDTKISLEKKERELDLKISQGVGDDTLKAELEKTKTKLNELQIKEAKYLDYEENDYKSKFEASKNELSGLKLAVAYQSVKPIFPDTVNKYEANAKWKEFIENTNSLYNIELDKENEAWAVDKENEHKRFKLKSIIEKDKTITELATGRSVKGLGSVSADKQVNIEGVPFAISDKATSTEREKLIREYLTTTKNMSVVSNDYAKEFKRLNDLILKKN